MAEQTVSIVSMEDLPGYAGPESVKVDLTETAGGFTAELVDWELPTEADGHTVTLRTEDGREAHAVFNHGAQAFAGLETL